MLLIIDSIFEYYYKNPIVFTFFLLFVGGGTLILYSNAQKASAAGINLHTSKSKPANFRKTIAFCIGGLMILISILVAIGYIPIDVKNLAPNSPASPQRIVSIGNEIGGFGELPIIRIDRKCFDRTAHEYENYVLFGGNFKNEIDAMKRVSTLDAYNIRNVNYFERKCDSIPMIGGLYFVLLGRRCTSLASVQRYEKKYETMFTGTDSMDLKIVKWEDGITYSNSE